jgi:hypothetical protein
METTIVMIGSADKGGYRFASAPQFSRRRSDADNWVIVGGAGTPRQASRAQAASSKGQNLSANGGLTAPR